MTSPAPAERDPRIDHLLTFVFNGVPVTVPAWPKEALYDVFMRATVAAQEVTETRCTGVTPVGWGYYITDANGVVLENWREIGPGPTRFSGLDLNAQSRLFAGTQPQTHCGIVLPSKTAIIRRGDAGGGK